MPLFSANNKNDNIVYSIKTIQVFTFNMGNNKKKAIQKSEDCFLLQILQRYIKYNNELEEWKRDIILFICEQFLLLLNLFKFNCLEIVLLSKKINYNALQTYRNIADFMRVKHDFLRRNLLNKYMHAECWDVKFN